MNSQFELNWQQKYDFFFKHFSGGKAVTDAKFLDAQKRAAQEADRTRVFDFTGHVRQF